MNPPSGKLRWSVGVGVLLLLLTLALAFLLAGLKSGIAQNSRPPVYGQIDDFNLTNQADTQVTLADLRGHPWVADIIFTRCAGPCPRMSQQMKELQDALPPGGSPRLVTLTTDPDYDTPTILSRYAERFGADTNRWMFLTGTKAQIGKLATGGLKLSAVAKQPAEQSSSNDLFVHSTIFVVVDKQAQLRGIFQTGGQDVKWEDQKQKILEAVQLLEREP